LLGVMPKLGAAAIIGLLPASRPWCTTSGAFKIPPSAWMTWSISAKTWRCCAVQWRLWESKSLGQRAFLSHSPVPSSACGGSHGYPWRP